MATGRKNGHPDRFLSRKNRLGQTAFWQTVGAIAIAKRNVDYL